MYKHWWFSGRILACHAGGPDSIPGPCVGANFLRVTILVSFPSINRTKSLWSIAFPSWLSFLGFWKIVVFTKRNFGSHKFWKKVFCAPRSICFLHFFMRRFSCAWLKCLVFAQSSSWRKIVVQFSEASVSVITEHIVSLSLYFAITNHFISSYPSWYIIKTDKNKEWN